MGPFVAAVSGGQTLSVPTFAVEQAAAGAIPVAQLLVAQEISNRRQTAWCCYGSRSVCLVNQGVIVMPAAPPDAV